MASGTISDVLKWKTLGTGYSFVNNESSAIQLPTEFNEILVNIYSGATIYGKMLFVPDEFSSTSKLYRTNGYYETAQYRADVVTYIKTGKIWGFVRVDGAIVSTAKADVFYR